MAHLPISRTMQDFLLLSLEKHKMMMLRSFKFTKNLFLVSAGIILANFIIRNQLTANAADETACSYRLAKSF
jgi:hypothetical protein